MSGFSEAIRQFQSQVFYIGPKLFFAIVVFGLFFLLALILRGVIKAAVARTSTLGHVDNIVAQLGYIAVLVIGGISALSISGLVNVAAMVASLGLAGFAVGFALKDILGNFLSGVLILVQRPYTIGDTIAVSGVEGQVVELRVRDTLVKTSDGTLVYVPNNIIFSNIVANKSAFSKTPVTLKLKTAGDVQVGPVLRIAAQGMAEHSNILDEPLPSAVVDELTESAVGFTLNFWIKAGSNEAQIKSDLLSDIHKLSEAWTGKSSGDNEKQ